MMNIILNELNPKIKKKKNIILGWGLIRNHLGIRLENIMLICSYDSNQWININKIILRLFFLDPNLDL